MNNSRNNRKSTKKWCQRILKKYFKNVFKLGHNYYQSLQFTCITSCISSDKMNVTMVGLFAPFFLGEGGFFATFFSLYIRNFFYYVFFLVFFSPFWRPILSLWKVFLLLFPHVGHVRPQQFSYGGGAQKGPPHGKKVAKRRPHGEKGLHIIRET